MPNPFKELKQQYMLKQFEEEGWEEVDGPMQCQTRDCRLVASEGKYSESLKIVTWKCSEGHVSRLENYKA